jgi:hypothetical protein
LQRRLCAYLVLSVPPAAPTSTWSCLPLLLPTLLKKEKEKEERRKMRRMMIRGR